jgi:protein SCO1/2
MASQDISGVLPPLDLSMIDANTGKPVTASDFHGTIVLLYFGYIRSVRISVRRR